MHRFRFLITATIALLAFDFATAIQAVEEKTSGRPNVVLIISDDQGATDYGFMGHAHVRTPHLDQTRRMLSMARKPGRRRLGLDACGASHLTVTVECLKSPQRRTRNGECYGTAATTNCGARKR